MGRDIVTTREIEEVWQQSLPRSQIEKRVPTLQKLRDGVVGYQSKFKGLLGLGIFGSFLRTTFREPENDQYPSDIDFVALEDEVPDALRLPREKVSKNRRLDPGSYTVFAGGDPPTEYFRTLIERLTSREQSFESSRLGTLLSDWEPTEFGPKTTSLLFMLVPAILSPAAREKIDLAVLQRIRSVSNSRRTHIWNVVKFEYDEFVAGRTYHSDQMNKEERTTYTNVARQISFGHPPHRQESLIRQKDDVRDIYMKRSPEFQGNFVSTNPMILTGLRDFVRRINERGTHF